MHDNNSLNYLGCNPSQLQENLSSTPFLDSLDYVAFDLDLAQPWSNDFYTWDEPLFPSPSGLQDTQQEPLPTPVADLASSTGSDTLVDKSFSEAVVSPSPRSPAVVVKTSSSPAAPTKTRDHACPWPDCTHKSTTKRDLDRHTASRHEGKPKKHTCRTDPDCPRRLTGWVRKDLRDRHEKIHLRHSPSRAVKRRASVPGELQSGEREIAIGPDDAESRREKLLSLPKEELVARVVMLEDKAASVKGFVALAHEHV